MKVLCCHPSGLMYTQILLRLEPLDVEVFVLRPEPAKEAAPAR